MAGASTSRHRNLLAARGEEVAYACTSFRLYVLLPLSNGLTGLRRRRCLYDATGLFKADCPGGFT